MKAEIIKTSGERIPVKPENGTDFELHEMQEIVGGWIEIVYLRDGRIMVVNEEGKVNRLEPNIVATNLGVYWLWQQPVADKRRRGMLRTM